MMNTTPLRLVAIEETPSDEDEQNATPVTMMSEQDAITRKVPESEMIATHDNLPDKPKRSRSLKIPLAVAAVAVVVIGAIVALAIKRERTAIPAPVNATGAPKELAQPQQPATPPSPAAASAPQMKPVPEIIRLGITADPMETELSLDGNVLAGHWLNLEVPKDRGIHVVSASAPGYIPFNQQVSFSSDVVLKINLHRAHTPPARQGARTRPSQLESRSKNNVRPAAVSPGPGPEPGMNLDGPPMRHNAKPIDERNPYKP